MKDYFFFNLTRKVIIQLLDTLNDITIARYNDDGTIRKYIKVPLKFAPKDRDYAWLYNRSHQMILPQMAMFLTQFAYASDRQVNKNAFFTQSVSGSSGINSEMGTDSEIIRAINPVPYDLSFDLSIATKYTDDMTQVIEQILPYFAPEIYIRIPIPELKLGLLNLKVIFEGCNPDTNVEIGENNFKVPIWTISFRVQSYLCQPVEITPIIYKVIMNMYTDEDKFDSRDTSTPMVSASQGDQPFDSASVTIFTQGLNKAANGEITYLQTILEEHGDE